MPLRPTSASIAVVPAKNTLMRSHTRSIVAFEYCADDGKKRPVDAAKRETVIVHFANTKAMYASLRKLPQRQLCVCARQLCVCME